MSLQQILRILNDLKPAIRRQYHAELKGVFGSYAREETRQDSDLDILAEFQESATLFDLAAMGDFLEETLHCKVDILSHRAIREELKPSIYEELITI